MTPAQTPLAPAWFISHGSPMTGLLEDDAVVALQKMSTDLSQKPKAIVIVSAHGPSAPNEVWVTGLPTPSLVYDFYGFPDELYAQTYACPGDPELAERVGRLAQKAGFRASLTDRGLDHGVWVPLKIAFPAAEIPVLQVSLPYDAEDPRPVLKLGQALASLREENILIIGSGGATHNLQRLNWAGKEGPAFPWASEFQTFLVENLRRKDVLSLLQFPETAPHAALNHPTPEHLFPLFLTLGASLPGDELTLACERIFYGSLSMLTFALQNPSKKAPSPTLLSPGGNA